MIYIGIFFSFYLLCLFLDSHAHQTALLGPLCQTTVLRIDLAVQDVLGAI